MGLMKSKMLSATVFVLMLLLAWGCSSDVNTAGTLIETNTGNKILIETNTGSGLARVYLVPSSFNASVNDTLILEKSEREFLNDTLVVYGYKAVVDSASAAADLLELKHLSAGRYDSVEVRPVEGSVKSFAINLDVEEDQAYYLDSVGVSSVVVQHATGKKLLVKALYVSVKDFDIHTGDSVRILGQQVALSGDTMMVDDCNHVIVADSPSVATGMLESVDVPQGEYNKVEITSKGKKKTVELNYEMGSEGSFYLDSTGSKLVKVSHKTVREGNSVVYFSMEYLKSVAVGDTLRFGAPVSRRLEGDSIITVTNVVEYRLSEEDVSSKVLLLEKIPEGYYKGFVVSNQKSTVTYDLDLNISAENKSFVYSDKNASAVESIEVKLPEGFEDLSAVDESFKDMPIPVRTKKRLGNPCLVDSRGGVVLLEATSADSLLYWGRMDQVVFTENGTLKFDLLDSCNGKKDSVSLARRVEHFDNSVLSEIASARFDQMDAAFGGALWTDSTDNWYMINNFEPFTKDGYQMSTSVWIKADSASQPAPGKNYTRILSAKKDSVGFIIQQRADHPAVNVRIDARKDGKGVYNSAYGNAWILDGEWHNYSLTIRGDSLYTYADGEVVSKNKFENGSGFSTCTNPAVGYEKNNLVGGLDEIFFFDGSQTENWMRLFFALQKQAR